MYEMRQAIFSVTLLAFLIVGVSASAADNPSDKERELINVLRSGAPAEKAIACKELAIHGSAAAVPELAKLLSDEQLASWSRIALEAIPGAAVDEALRNAMYSLQGKLLVGVINSIGVRRDAGAVERLVASVAGSGCRSGFSSRRGLGADWQFRRG